MSKSWNSRPRKASSCWILTALLLLTGGASPGTAEKKRTLTVDGCRLAVRIPGWSAEVTPDGKRVLMRGPSRSGSRDVITLLSITLYDRAGTPLSREVENHLTNLAANYNFKDPRITRLARLKGLEKDHQVGDHEARFHRVTRLAPAQPRAELLEAVVAIESRFVYASLYHKAVMLDEYEELFSQALLSLELEVPEPDPSTPDDGGAGDGQIAWKASFSAAFEEARRRRVPVFIAIGSDREAVCLELARNHYRNPSIVALSRKMVCLVASADNHGLDENETCNLYHEVNCAEHRDVEIRMREHFMKRSIAIAPQHLIASPEAHVLSRREFMLSRADLERMMRGAIAALQSLGELGEGIELARKIDYAARYAAARQDAERQLVLNSAFHFSDLKSVKKLLDSIARTEGKKGVLEMMRFLELADHPDKLEILLFYLESPNEFIRRKAAVLLGRMEDVRAAPKLVETVKRTKENNRVRAKALLALGSCGPGSPVEKEVLALIKRHTRTGPGDLRISALIALARFPGDTEGLESILVQAYGANKGNFSVKSVAALVMGRHRLGGAPAIRMMRKDTEKITDRSSVGPIDWAIRCLEGAIEDPELEFENLVMGYTLDGDD